jgi:hypothetical protein
MSRHQQERQDEDPLRPLSTTIVRPLRGVGSLYDASDRGQILHGEDLICLAPRNIILDSHEAPPLLQPRLYFLQPDLKERLIGGLLLASLIHVWVFGVIVAPLAMYKLLAQVGWTWREGEGEAGEVGGELLPGVSPVFCALPCRS